MEDDNSFGQSYATEDNLNFPYVARHSAHGSIDGQQRQFRCVASFPISLLHHGDEAICSSFLASASNIGRQIDCSCHLPWLPLLLIRARAHSQRFEQLAQNERRLVRRKDVGMGQGNNMGRKMRICSQPWRYQSRCCLNGQHK